MSFAMLGFVLLTTVIGCASQDVHCPPGWLAGDLSNCYMFGRDNMTFANAEIFCRVHGGHLVQAESKHENNFIKDRLRLMKAHFWWIGITDEYIEGEWRWFLDSSLSNYTDFGPSEPQPERGEDCAMFSFGGNAWADVGCTATIVKPICEKRATVCPKECLSEIIG